LPFDITEREITAPGQELSLEEAVLLGQQEAPNPQLVDQVFSLFKGYLSSQLEEKGRQLEESAKIDKEAPIIKFKGNRNQFELNSRLSNILSQIEDSVEKPSSEVRKLVAEGQHLIKKRQKLIKIADRKKDGWLVVQEYESNDLASDSEGKKKLRKAKVAAERKRKEAKGNSGNAAKKFKSISDFQLVFYLFTL